MVKCKKKQSQKDTFSRSFFSLSLVAILQLNATSKRSRSLFSVTRPYPGIVEAETEEGQLEIEVLVDLRRRGVYVALVITDVLIATLVVEPVQKVGADLRESLRGDDVRLSIVLVRRGWQHPAVDVS